MSKIPNASNVVVSVDGTDDISLYANKLLENIVVRVGCFINTPFGLIRIVHTTPEEGQKSQDVLIASGTKMEVLKESPELEKVFRDSSDCHPELYELLETLICFPKAIKSLGVDVPKGVLIHGPPGVGKTFAVSQICEYWGCELITIHGAEVHGSGKGASEQLLIDYFSRAKLAAKSHPVVILIDEIDTIAPSRLESKAASSVVAQLLVLMDGLDGRGNVIVIGTTNRPNSIDPALRRPGRFDREIEIAVPDKVTRSIVLEKQLTKISHCVDIDYIASITNGYVMADLTLIVRESILDSIAKNSLLNTDHFLLAIKNGNGPAIKRSSSETIPNLSWCAVAGLDKLKEKIQTSILKPILEASWFRSIGLSTPRGVLLYGPPGCSKTTIAKIMASISHFSFHTVNGAQIYSSLLGESELTIRNLFSRARQTAPSFIFLDELDALVSNRSNSNGDSVQDRVLSTLLNEMDGISNSSDVIVMASTNRPDLIDSALLRPGRFDVVLYVPPPDEEARKAILELYTTNLTLHASLDLEALAKNLHNYTGADIQSLCREATLSSIKANRDYIVLSVNPGTR